MPKYAEYKQGSIEAVLSAWSEQLQPRDVLGLDYSCMTHQPETGGNGLAGLTRVCRQSGADDTLSGIHIAGLLNDRVRTHYPPETPVMKPATRRWISAGGRL